MSFIASFAEPSQSFPATLAAVQAFFPAAASAQVWLFNQASGPVPEAVANLGNLTVTGSPHAGLDGAAIGKRCTSIRRGGTDGYLGVNSTVLNADGSFTFFCWVMWDPDASGALCYVVDKVAGGAGGTGWSLKTAPSTYNIVATVTDGVQPALTATTATGTVFSGKSYQQGAWIPIMVTWDTVMGVLTIRTNREAVTATDEDMAGSSLSNAVAAAVGNIRNPGAAGNALRGSLAYMLHMPGFVASAAEFTAFVKYGTMTGTNLSRATPAGDGCVTLDTRDSTVGTKVVVRDKTQPAFDQRFGKNGMLFENQGLNALYETEEIGSTTTWTNDAGINLTRDYGQAPRRGSWSTTRLQKTAAGALKYTASSTYSLFTNNVAAGVMARANTAGNKLTLRLTADNGTPLDQTESFALTTEWAFYALTATVNNEACAGKLYIAAGDINDIAALADIEVWGARANVTLNGLQYYPNHLVNNQAGAMGVVTGTDVVPLPNGACSIELGFVPTTLPVGVNKLWYCTAAGANGGIAFSYGGSIRCLQFDLTNAAAETESTTYWDLLKSWLLYTRTHLVGSWDVATQTAQTYVNGAGCLPLQQLAAGVSTLPSLITPEFSLGTNGAGSYIGAVIEVLSISPTYFDCETVQEMSAAAGVTPANRIACMGDSITGFYDGYHVELNTLLGVGNGDAVVANFGLSGNTTDQMLARFNENIYQDSLGGKRNWNSVLILGGINDTLFFGRSAAHIIGNLTTMRDRALAWGLKVAFGTILPCRGRSEWTPSIQGVIDTVNTWIRTQPNVFDFYALLSVTTTGTFNGGHAGNANGTGPGYFGGAAGGGVQNGAGTQTYDELHQTGSGANVASAPIQNTGAQRGSDAMGDLAFLSFPLGDYPTARGGTSTSTGGGPGLIGVDDSQSSPEEATIFLGVDDDGRETLYVEEPEHPLVEEVRRRFVSKLLWLVGVVAFDRSAMAWYLQRMRIVTALALLLFCACAHAKPTVAPPKATAEVKRPTHVEAADANLLRALQAELAEQVARRDAAKLAFDAAERQIGPANDQLRSMWNVFVEKYALDPARDSYDVRSLKIKRVAEVPK